MLIWKLGEPRAGSLWGIFTISCFGLCSLDFGSLLFSFHRLLRSRSRASSMCRVSHIILLLVKPNSCIAYVQPECKPPTEIIFLDLPSLNLSLYLSTLEL